MIRKILTGRTSSKTDNSSHVIPMKVVPIKKQSKKAQRQFHLKQRGDWNGVNPTTRVIKSRKIYDRKKLSKPTDTE